MDDPTTVRVRRALRGDENEVNWLVAHFHPLVLVHLRDRLGGFATDDDVRDLADDVWLVTLRRLGDLTPREGRLTPVLARFLATTALNLANNHLRSLARRTPADRGASCRLDDLSAGDSGIVTRASRRELNAAVVCALDRLSDVERAIVTRRLLAGERNKDIASELRLSENAVAVHYRRALESMRLALDPELFSEIRRLGR